ncbi:acetyl-CoA carboxylase biotin carboxyl carrier protein [Salinispora arenicola]|uniref:acetyl-CoA carboxylase biotin carboxyl carrier protein n=1 Tax=Salinispora arenicola TaxID=168697 RepID=UPI00035C331D|nr:acetyl-CoA carboxylase biotin carboxyl carrier protein [Salinispora arenicola]NIL42256.1 acetyl-CoA carboxylase biotin carboxyl carrier protein [Salinispora arenicola]
MSAESVPTGASAVNGGPAADAVTRTGSVVEAVTDSGASTEGTLALPSGVLGDAALAGLRRQALELLADLAGPVRRVRLDSGDAVLEVEWHSPGDAAHPTPPPPPAASVVTAPPVAVPAVPPIAVPPVAVPAARHAVRSPIVGTFYRAPEPGAAPFVAIGDRVHPGQVVGIVEAMKLMNEVTADRAGRIAEVLADDGQPVEYDQPLLAVDPA